jgi:hypothetical protein
MEKIIRNSTTTNGTCLEKENDLTFLGEKDLDREVPLTHILHHLLGRHNLHPPLINRITLLRMISKLRMDAVVSA